MKENVFTSQHMRMYYLFSDVVGSPGEHGLAALPRPSSGEFADRGRETLVRDRQ